jgi:poly-gamma-glutamate capsule biosynthesis protein CapA/YwtB (metallophosphatase superfamily)
MLGTNFPNAGYLPPNDGKDMLAAVKGILQTGDITFGNLEGVLLTDDGPVKKCSDPSVCYAFKTPDHYINYFLEAGFNLLSVANNHVNDFGEVGVRNTLRVLQEAGIPHAGLKSVPYTTFEKEGVKFGFAAFAPNSGTIPLNDYANAKKIIAHLDSISDLVIVSFHGGAEGAAMRHITRKTETFLGENRGNPYEFARMVIDAGADVVLGHGPHVTRALDTYKNRLIVYSMGNFATYGRFNLSGPNGISPIIEVEMTKNGEFIRGKIHSTMQVGKGIPALDESQRVLKEIQQLTAQDIPESILEINEDGTFFQKKEDN